ncbi:MAG: 50S ribosomal protein L32 [Alphaproteobacteria bacterium]|nr:MAG: 50S ribosomal protein L32 [Alphaproteobacteria bacterium]
MAVPKKRVSVSRRGMRNAHRKTVKPVNLVECNSCGSYKLQHHVCPSCGIYNGRQIIAQKVKDED